MNDSRPIASECQLDSLVKALGVRLTARGERMVAVESCTGGWIAKAVTDVAGSSAWFDSALVTYSNRAKQALANVSSATLNKHGAVSAQTVAAMADGALHGAAADWAIATSGVAGPGGGSAYKPVGTVWFAWKHRDAQPQTQCVHFSGDRRTVRLGSTVYAIQRLVDLTAPAGT